MKKSALFSAVSVLLLVSACARDVDDLRYFPLEVGRTWEYKWEGEPKDPSIRLRMERGSEPGTYVLDGPSLNGYVIHLEKGRLFVRFRDEKSALDAVWFRFPLRTGREWTFTSKGETLRARVLGRASTTVPAGTFSDCVKIVFLEGKDRKEDKQRRTVFWLAYDVGLVRLDLGPEGLFSGLLVLSSYTKP